jgi:hypothetical protein
VLLFSKKTRFSIKESLAIPMEFPVFYQQEIATLPQWFRNKGEHQ